MGRRIKKWIPLIVSFLMIVSTVSPAFAAKAVRPDITAAGAIVYCENTGEIVFSKNMNTKLSPYSITKLMTALLAVQNLPMDKEVTVSKEAAAQQESSMDLKVGEVLTVKELLYGTLLLSGNDAAYALGEAVSGNMTDFVQLMNKTAANIGCENTHFMNPNGMKKKGHYTTAYDMMQIARVALSNETVKTISGTKKYTVDATNKHKKRILKSHLKFIYDPESGVYAGKTGYWDDFDCSIALGYKEDGLSLYVVLIGDTAKARDKDVTSVIKYATQKVEGIKVIGGGKETGKIRIKHGAKTSLKTYTAETGYAYLPKEASKSLISTKTVMNGDVTAPISAGTVVGTYQIYAADELVNEVDIIVKEDVAVGWFPSYLGISNMATILICTITAFLVILLTWFTIARARIQRRKKLLRQQKARRLAIEQMKKEKNYNERDWRF